MNMKHMAASAVMALVLGTGAVGLVSAQTVADATGLTEEQVIEIALNEVPGEVTEVERERRRGHDVYEVEIQTEEGREREVIIDAESGDVLRVKGEHRRVEGEHRRVEGEHRRCHEHRGH